MSNAPLTVEQMWTLLQAAKAPRANPTDAVARTIQVLEGLISHADALHHDLEVQRQRNNELSLRLDRMVDTLGRRVTKLEGVHGA